jgi:hypothetical protein
MATTWAGIEWTPREILSFHYRDGAQAAVEAILLLLRERVVSQIHASSRDAEIIADAVRTISERFAFWEPNQETIALALGRVHEAKRLNFDQDDDGLAQYVAEVAAIPGVTTQAHLIHGESYRKGRFALLYQFEDEDGRNIVFANPEESIWAMLYVLWFSQHAPLRVAVWADGLEDALEEAADYLKEFAPGMFADEAELAKDARTELGPDAEDEAIWEWMDMDMTRTESGLISSEDWGIWFDGENMAPAETSVGNAAVSLRAFLAGEEEKETEE